MFKKHLSCRHVVKPALWSVMGKNSDLLVWGCLLEGRTLASHSPSLALATSWLHGHLLSSATTCCQALSSKISFPSQEVDRKH